MTFRSLRKRRPVFYYRKVFMLLGSTNCFIALKALGSSDIHIRLKSNLQSNNLSYKLLQEIKSDLKSFMDLLLVISLTLVIFEQALVSSSSRFSTWGKHITFDELTCVRTVFMLFMRTSENPLSVSKANTIILPDLKVVTLEAILLWSALKTVTFPGSISPCRLSSLNSFSSH